MTMFPSNEAETITMYKLTQDKLGWRIVHLQTAFPDAIIENSGGQRLVVEFEYLAKNFKAHKHDKDGCDLIVCWHNNWSGAPLPVWALDERLAQEARLVSGCIQRCRAKVNSLQGEVTRWGIEVKRLQDDAVSIKRLQDNNVASLRRMLSVIAKRAEVKGGGRNPLSILNKKAFEKATAFTIARTMLWLGARLDDFFKD